jgi:hypothetical protein
VSIWPKAPVKIGDGMVRNLDPADQDCVLHLTGIRSEEAKANSSRLSVGFGSRDCGTP